MKLSLFSVLMLIVGLFFVAVGGYIAIRYDFVFGGPYLIGGLILAIMVIVKSGGKDE